MRTRVFDLHSKKNMVYHRATFFIIGQNYQKIGQNSHAPDTLRWKKFDHYTVSKY